MIKYWVSTERVTGQVNTRDGMIVFTPPIWRKFLGQPFQNLKNWLRDVSVVKL